MAVFRVLPIERCLELITAWTEAPWPITTEQGREVAIKLGWTQDRNHSQLFVSELARTGKGDCICNSMDGLTSWVSFPLAARASGEKEEITAPIIAERGRQVIELLIEKYGKPTLTEVHNGIKADEWDLGSGVSVRINYSRKILTVAISSPEVVGILEDPRSDPDYERL